MSHTADVLSEMVAELESEAEKFRRQISYWGDMSGNGELRLYVENTAKPRLAKIEAQIVALKEPRALMLSFIASLTLADHMGDVSNDVEMVLKRLGVEIEWGEWDELGRALGRIGVKTLYGTDLTDGEEDEIEDDEA